MRERLCRHGVQKKSLRDQHTWKRDLYLPSREGKQVGFNRNLPNASVCPGVRGPDRLLPPKETWTWEPALGRETVSTTSDSTFDGRYTPRWCRPWRCSPPPCKCLSEGHTVFYPEQCRPLLHRERFHKAIRSPFHAGHAIEQGVYRTLAMG